MNKKYCMDCGHYVPGGKEYNCTAAVKFNDRSVSALKEACHLYKDREEETETPFPKIEMRRRKRRKY